MSKKNNAVVIASLQLCLPSDSRVRADITLSGAMSDTHPLAEFLCKELSLSAATILQGLGREILRARKPSRSEFGLPPILAIPNPLIACQCSVVAPLSPSP